MNSVDVVPMLNYENGVAALEWLAQAFEFKEVARICSPDGTLEHGEMIVGNARIMLATTAHYESPRTHRGHCARAQQWLACAWVIDGVLVYVDDIDAHIARAKNAGARILSEIEDGFPGRRYRTEDLEGHRWFFLQRERRGP